MISAVKKWWNSAGTLAVMGLGTYLGALILGSATYAILAPLGEYFAGSVATVVLLLTYAVSGTIIAEDAAQGKISTIHTSLERLKKSWIDVGIATIYTWMPIILGTLITLGTAAYAIAEGNDAVAGIGTLIFVCGVIISVLLSLAPYIAAKNGWEHAIRTAHQIGATKYITLLALGIAYGIFYIILLSFLPTAIGAVLAAADALAVMHIRNIMYYEVLDSVSARE